MPVSVFGGPSVGFHACVNMNSLHIIQPVKVCVCVCLHSLFELFGFSFHVSTNMHVRMCLDKIERGQ